MATGVAYKYRGFISYSHKDTSWARWVHRSFEGWRIDADLKGRTTPVGPIPDKLGPIFRDRDDFSAGQDLSVQTKDVLANTGALIPLCSPASARSKMVNEEIRLFRHTYPERLVIPLIIAGKPGDPDNECFPPSLRFQLAPDGTVTDRPFHMLAADAQDDGDGRDLAMAKIVAQLIGLSTDEVFRRAERERRRKARIRNIVTAALGVLTVVAIAGAVLTWLELQRNNSFLTTMVEETNRLVEVVEKQGTSRASTTGVLKQTEGMYDGMRRFGRGSPLGNTTPALELREAEMRLRLAYSYASIGRTDLGLAEAQKAINVLAGLAGPANTAYQPELARAHVLVGDLHSELNQAKLALEQFQAGSAIWKRLVARDPAGVEAQRGVASTAMRAGLMLLLSTNRRDDAQREFQTALDICERLATADPSNDENQHELGRALIFMGDIQLGGKQFDAAQAHYARAHDIRRALVAAKPDSQVYLRMVAESSSKLGHLFFGRERLVEARTNYEEALEINRRLVAVDRSNALRQRDLSATLNAMGDVLEKQNLLPQALAYYEQSLAIARDLEAQDPRNAQRKRDVASALVGIASIQKEIGKADDAMVNYKIAHKRIEELASAAPGDRRWPQYLKRIEADMASVDKAISARNIIIQGSDSPQKQARD